jgi:hypothetical protein
MCSSHFSLTANWCNSNIFGSWPKKEGATPLFAYIKNRVNKLLNPSDGMVDITSLSFVGENHKGSSPFSDILFLYRGYSLIGKTAILRVVISGS